MYISIYAHIRMHIYIYIYTCIHVCLLYVYVYVLYTYIYIYIYIHVRSILRPPLARYSTCQPSYKAGGFLEGLGAKTWYNNFTYDLDALPQ